MAQQIIDGQARATGEGVQTERTGGWMSALLRDGPRVLGSLFGLILGAGLLTRLFVGEFVADYKLALLLTVGVCGLGLAVPFGVMGIIWMIRETSKASVAGVSQQMTEMAGLVRESIGQTNAVTNTLVQITGAYMGKAGSGTVIQQLPAAEGYTVKKLAKADLITTDDGEMLARDKLIQIAETIYAKMYAQRIEPTQENVKRICGITSNGHITKALDVLAGWGVCTPKTQGREREWLYKESDRNDS
jgi:hypothetical protein